jgi:hypothetical protein
MKRPSFSTKRTILQLAFWSCLIATLVVPEVHAQTAAGAAKAKPGMTEMTKPAASLSTSLTVTIEGKPTKFTVAELKAMPQKTVKVHNEHSNADEVYSGVELADVLAKCGFVVGKTEHHTIIRSYLRVEGTDKYWVLYSALEVEPTEHNGDVIVAMSMNAGAIGVDGALKLVSTDDKKPQRWVRNLSAITLKTVQ